MNMIAAPECTQYRKKNGLDPLGMQNSSVGLYQTLLPGVSNVTLRVRYFGLYAWLSAVHAQEVGDTDPKRWQRFLRRAKALCALTAQRRGGETGVAGVRWATSIVAILVLTACDGRSTKAKTIEVHPQVGIEAPVLLDLSGGVVAAVLTLGRVSLAGWSAPLSAIRWINRGLTCRSEFWPAFLCMPRIG